MPEYGEKERGLPLKGNPCSRGNDYIGKIVRYWGDDWLYAKVICTCLSWIYWIYYSNYP